MGAFLTLLNPLSTILDKVLPDKAQNDAAKAQLVQLQLNGELNNALAQLDVDKTEAASNSVFVAGWRPFVGWVCGIAFLYDFVLQPFLQFIIVAAKVNFDVSKIPQVNSTEMMPVLLGMLGLGAMRSYDKAQGTTTGH